MPDEYRQRARSYIHSPMLCHRFVSARHERCCVMCDHHCYLAFGQYCSRLDDIPDEYVLWSLWCRPPVKLLGIIFRYKSALLRAGSRRR